MPGVPSRARLAGTTVGILPRMDRPPPDPAKLLAYWNEWETGETPPGRVMANLKTAGLPELLEQLVAASQVPAQPA